MFKDFEQINASASGALFMSYHEEYKRLKD